MNKKFLISFLLISSLSAIAAKESDLQDYEQQKLQAERLKSSTQSQMLILNEQISSLNKELETKKTDVSQKMKTLKRLNNYQWGSLLALKDVVSFEKNLRVLKQINEKEFSDLREFLYLKEELEQQNKSLTKSIDSYNKTLATITAAEEIIKRKEKEELEKIMDGRILSLLKFKGQLSSPMSAKPIKTYGVYKVPNSQIFLHQTGLLYKADPGSHIQAVGPGKVIFSDVLDHWDKAIIIEHDGGYFSVYANIRSPQVQVDQEVTQGQHLAEATQENFYFELRHKKTIINPKDWIKE